MASDQGNAHAEGGEFTPEELRKAAAYLRKANAPKAKLSGAATPSPAPAPAPSPAPAPAPAPRAKSRKGTPSPSAGGGGAALLEVSLKKKGGRKTKAEQAAAKAEHEALMRTWREKVSPLTAEELEERFDFLCVAKTGAEFEAEEGVASGAYGGENKVYIGVVYKILMGLSAAPFCFKVRWDDDTEESMHYDEVASHHRLFREKQKGVRPKRERPFEWHHRQFKKKMKSGIKG